MVGKHYTEKELRKLRSEFKKKMQRGKHDKIVKETGLLRSASSVDEGAVDIGEVLRSAMPETIEVRPAPPCARSWTPPPLLLCCMVVLCVRGWYYNTLLCCGPAAAV